MNAGWSWYVRTNVNAGPPPSSCVAWITRSMYVSTDIPDQCGAITMPIARSMPSARIAAIACGMNGSECFIPR